MDIDAGVRLKGLSILFYFAVAVGLAALASIQLTASAPPREAPDDWGSTAYYIRSWLALGISFLCLVISVAPTRWFVTAPFAFYGALAITLVPAGRFLMATPVVFASRTLVDALLTLGFLLVVVVLSALLPCSLVRAYRRYRTTGCVGYF